MTVQIHQFSPTLSYGDAISNQTLSLQAMLRGMGYESEIFCDRMPLHFEGRARPLTSYGRFSAAENVLICHFALSYSPRAMAWLKQVPDRRVLVYHNITPHTYFAGISHAALRAAQAGRAQLDELRGLVEAGWGDSTYNCQELADRGWDRLGVLPIVFQSERYATRPDRRMLGRWAGGLNVLFVGRVSPNKRFEDLIMVFYYLKRHARSDARLILVGSAGGMETYARFLRALVSKLGLDDVVFTGHISNAELVACYRRASLYLSMSEHEGFGVPLLESMHFGVPILAYKAAAVPETLGGSGVLFTEKDYPALAELIALLDERQDLRERIVARQRVRLQAFTPQRVETRLRGLLDDLGIA